MTGEPSDSSFQDWMKRLRSGDDMAATHVFQRFADRLIRLAQARIGNRLKGKVEAGDVVQSVYRSFFVRNTQGSYEDYGLNNWDSLWSLLALITVGKCAKKVRDLHAQKRDIDREIPLGDGEVWDVLGAEPSPESALLLSELVEELFTVAGERNRDILMLALQGNQSQEIATALGISQRRVQRVLQRVKSHLSISEGSET
jgi:RNA polymerase sigma factor (sigma-70 family)